ncbi:hypothetical protein SAMN06295945_0010 [Polynucleobacter meluiroseus]|uniref:Lipocalin-like domain-containing protein n=1 Tax=Polynucleobacter meluiroseus TaxID=1938814 RepID=A0A240DYF4_9BURK|nr:hypothetical protein [Polynucleobacter meluiroseus]SNX27694.1 hypothetical protein SAMN06295945_0010 [Polynucleobacter meluiroseus]
MIIKKILLVLAALTSSLALAQTAPNIVGTWEAVSAVSASGGTEDRQQRSVLSSKKDAAILKLTITTQEGAAFRGETAWQEGIKNVVVGVFQRDGKTIIISSDVAVGSGYVENNEMEYCSASVLTTKNRASCTILKKVK